MARFRLKVWQTYIPLSALFFCGYPLCIGPTVPNGRKRGGRERPPPKVGGHVTPDSGAEWLAAIRPHAGRSRPHLSLREGSEPAPGLVREEGVQMKGMYLGRRFYRQMFGAVLLTPVVVYVASLYPVITLGVGLVLYLDWRGWIEKRPSD